MRFAVEESFRVILLYYMILQDIYLQFQNSFSKASFIVEQYQRNPDTKGRMHGLFHVGKRKIVSFVNIQTFSLAKSNEKQIFFLYFILFYDILRLGISFYP